MSAYSSFPEYSDSGDEWLKEIPKHWTADRLQYLSQIESSGCYGQERQSENAPICRATCTTASITPDGRFRLGNMEMRYFSQEEIDRYEGRLGDIFIVKSSGSNTNIISGKLAVINERSVGVVFTNFLMRVRAQPSLIHSAFLASFLKSHVTKRRIERMVSTTTYPNIDVAEYARSLVPVPGLTDQKIIISFIDRETAHIDALIQNKTRFIDLLKEKREALITDAVTKGLDPKVKMKDSGVEWLGQVPEHWTVCALKRAFESMDYGISDSLGLAGEIAVLRMGNIVDGLIDTTDLKFVDSVEPSLMLRQGDLLFNRTNSLDLIGKVGLFRAQQIEDDRAYSFASYLVRLRCNERCIPNFFRYMLNMPPLLDVARASALVAIGQCNLNPSRYGEISVAIPPKDEQDAIASHLERISNLIGRIIDATHHSLALLHERRSAVITAAVTGQIDVREEVIA